MSTTTKIAAPSALIDEIRALLNKHAVLTDKLDRLNPLRETDMTQIQPVLETELLALGDKLAEATAELLGD